MQLVPFVIASSLTSLSWGHMEMVYPPPRGSQQLASSYPVDYNLNAPLGQPLMCGGKPPGVPMATLHAGQTVSVAFHGGARHGGGVCQFAVSYDGDLTFQLIQRVEGGCPHEGWEWPVALPSSLPACERCTFAWTWINAIGNREYYMNCADVRIESSQGYRRISGQSLMMANLPGYPTVQPPPSDASPDASHTEHYSVY